MSKHKKNVFLTNTSQKMCKHFFWRLTPNFIGIETSDGTDKNPSTFLTYCTIAYYLCSTLFLKKNQSVLLAAAPAPGTTCTCTILKKKAGWFACCCTDDFAVHTSELRCSLHVRETLASQSTSVGGKKCILHLLVHFFPPTLVL